MKTLRFACMSMLIFSCTEKKAETPAAEIPTPQLPMEVTYTGKTGIGSWDNVKVVMEWNKRLSQLNTDLGDLLADSVNIHLADGTEFSGPRDSIIQVLNTFVGQVSGLNLVYTAAVPVNNVDKNHEWVFSWTDETLTFKDGKIDHTFIHEDYRLEGGKIREIFQYSRKEPAKK
ncbi:MAG: hypothetical protein WAZ98_13480 [Cyclobacteriaceae bacterium]